MMGDVRRQQELGRHGETELISAGLHAIPNVVFVEGGGPAGLVITAHTHCRGQSIQLRDEVSKVTRAALRAALPVTLELEDGCSIANSYREHQIILKDNLHSLP